MIDRNHINRDEIRRWEREDTHKGRIFKEPNTHTLIGNTGMLYKQNIAIQRRGSKKRQLIDHEDFPLMRKMDYTK